MAIDKETTEFVRKVAFEVATLLEERPSDAAKLMQRLRHRAACSSVTLYRALGILRRAAVIDYTRRDGQWTRMPGDLPPRFWPRKRLEAYVENRTRFDELVERYRFDYDEYPDFRAALHVLVDFLADELDRSCRWPIYVFFTDGADEDDDGRPITRGWAFAILSDDTTSYIHTEDGGRVEWFGTSWVPGCECDHPSDGNRGTLSKTGEHLAGCPSRGEA